MTTLHWFWSAFWPNVAATLVGVVVGVPIALYLNSLAGKASHARAKADGAARLRNAVLSLSSALDHNELKISALKANLEQARAVFELGIDVAAWEATRSQVIENLDDPGLYRRLALYHSDLQNLSRLCVMYLDMVAGIASALGGVEGTRDALRNYLLARASQLLAESASLKNELAPVTQGDKAA